MYPAFFGGQYRPLVAGGNPQFIVKQGVVKQLRDGLKVLADGELTKALTVHAHRFSAKAKERIASLGGKAEVLEG